MAQPVWIPSPNASLLCTALFVVGLVGCSSQQPKLSGSEAFAAGLPSAQRVEAPRAAPASTPVLSPQTAPAEHVHQRAEKPATYDTPTLAPASSDAVQNMQTAPDALGAALVSEPPTLLAQGRASWYGKGFQGRRTASGERFDMHALTAAHRTLPMGSRVRVRSVHTGQEVVVRINDRGPYKHQRIIDLSYAAAKALGVHQRGVSEVVLVRE